MNTKILQTLSLVLLLSTSLYAVQSTKVNEHTNYTANVVPKKMTVQEKKQRFRDLVVPAVNKVYADLDAKYAAAKVKVDSGKMDADIKKLMKSYSAKNPQDLLTRMKPHAKSVAIAQAAMESAWATSRFTRVATNLFGVWSFNKNEPRVAAGEKRGKKTIYVKKYSSVEDSIRDYYRVLATGRVFGAFRAQKMRSNDPYKLVKKLDKYSEKGAEYGKELTSMIRYNRFYEFD
ncbi:glucosaminidase domain-containing protein [Sulfurimonas sp. SAG-AH-194-C20]|nr:glucosaminidase domain-containing protein [Sulfurimonas sp. SAG-AH-194-C20]MDF1878800.1 glucosaminidase domain-containing protein [Sulfurimonas sp. SAG-AH-194-C20]